MEESCPASGSPGSDSPALGWKRLRLIHTLFMSWGDVRGLLQYVPQFRGKLFVIVIDAPVPALAETMLDLVSLQNIGVQLVICSNVHTEDDLLDRAAEVELKFAQKPAISTSEPSEILTSLERGQAVIFDLGGQDPLSKEFADLAHSLSVVKLVCLQGAGKVLPQGAMRASDIDSSMPETLHAAAAVCHAGIDRVHFLDGSCPGVLLAELFSNEGVGTMVYADSYRVIRPLREEDIVELLGMIGRSVRNDCLVPRDFADVLSNLARYSVMEIDGNVVGSVALLDYPGEDAAEVACLYVKQSHEGLGYGTELVKHAEQQACELGVSTVFALTNRASAFFKELLAYTEASADNIPDVRREQLIDSGRDSRVFSKQLG